MIEGSVTAAELGSWLGISDRAVRDLGARGAVVRAEGGRYALRDSLRAYTANLRAAAAARGEGAGLTGERQRVARERADEIALRNAQARGELVPVAEVTREWTAILGAVRTRLLAVPARVGGRLAHLTQHDLAELDAELRAALTEAGEEKIGETQ